MVKSYDFCAKNTSNCTIHSWTYIDSRVQTLKKYSSTIKYDNDNDNNNNVKNILFTIG